MADSTAGELRGAEGTPWLRDWVGKTRQCQRLSSQSKDLGQQGKFTLFSLQLTRRGRKPEMSLTVPFALGFAFNSLQNRENQRLHFNRTSRGVS